MDNELGPDVRVGQQIERSLVTNSLTMDKSHQNTELCYLVSFTEWKTEYPAHQCGMCRVGARIFDIPAE